MISVIMPVTLQDYSGGATNREFKFIRAVKSFVAQTEVSGHELIIVSDGCKRSEEIYNTRWKDKINNIKFIYLSKQENHFAGRVRQEGIKIATNKWITYLDSDDKYGITHLYQICRYIKNQDKADWLYWNDVLQKKTGAEERVVEIELGRIGTSCIAHKKDLPVSWEGLDGYNHDFQFILQLKNHKSVKISKTEYHVHHQPGIFET